MDVENIEMTDEIIQDSLKALGITTEDVEKSKDEDIEKSEKTPPTEKEDKEHSTEGGDDYKMSEKYKSMEKAYSDAKGNLSKMEEDMEDYKKTYKKDTEKSEKPDIEKSEKNDLEDDKFKSLGVLIKAQNDELKAMREEREELTKSFSEMNEKINEIGTQSNGRKSFTSSTAIEKSFPGGEGDDGKTVFSISKNKTEISDKLLDMSGLEKGGKVDDLYLNAVSLFESSKLIEKSVLNDLYKNHDIKIVK